MWASFYLRFAYCSVSYICKLIKQKGNGKNVVAFIIQNLTHDKHTTNIEHENNICRNIHINLSKIHGSSTSLTFISSKFAYMLLSSPGPGPCITNVIATSRKNFSQWESSFLWKLRCHWLKFLRRVAKTLVIQGPGPLLTKDKIYNKQISRKPKPMR